VDDVLSQGHPYRSIVQETLLNRESRGPVAAVLGGSEAGGDAPAVRNERLIMTHAIEDLHGKLVGVMLVARNLGYLGQVQSTINYSRKLVALGRLSSGVAHEVKNPLNAMMIHLELLRNKLSSAMRPQPVAGPAGAGLAFAAASGRAAVAAAPTENAELSGVLEHVGIIAEEIRRLDQVVQGFLRFTRPEELRLQPVDLASVVDEIVQVVKPEAEKSSVAIEVLCPRDLPDIHGDPGMLRQAFLNLAINACQAMPQGGTLRIVCSVARGRRVEISFEDSGVGIKPEHLERIFDLYFTTKEQGSGIGLSMVYRIVQMHDGEVEVESTPGRGTKFRLLLPQA
jgi:signal transduction histidine kinase